MFKLSMIPFIPWAVYIVADKKGYWESQGLSVEVTIYPDEPGYVDDMVEKRSEFYPLPLSSVLELYNQNNPFYCTGFFDQANGHKKIFVKKKYASKLKNSTILVYSDEIANRYFLARYLSTCGLTLNDVHLIFADSEPVFEKYSNPEVSACLVFENDLNPILESTNSRIVYTTGDYTEPFTLAIPADKYIRELKEKLPGIVKGRILAVDWINQPENRKEFCRLVRQFMFNGSLNYSDDKIFRLYGGLTHPTLSGLKGLNSEPQSVFSDLTQTCLANGIISKKKAKGFNPERIMKNQFLIMGLLDSSESEVSSGFIV